MGDFNPSPSQILKIVFDAANEAITVNDISGGGGGGGTQYTEGEIDATITGNAIMWEDSADTLRAVSAAKPLPVDITTDSVGLATETTLSSILSDTANIDTNIGTIAGAVSGSEMQVDLVGIGGVATETTLSSILSDTANIDTNIATIAGDTTSIDGKLPSIGTQLSAASLSVVQASDDVFAISATSLPLPTGAATETTLSSILSDTANMDTNIATIAGAVSGSEMQVDVLTMPTVTVDSELPAAAALADATSNPTSPAVGSFGHVFNGTTWDRQKGDTTDGTLVNLGSNNDVKGEVAAEAAVSGTNPIIMAGKDLSGNAVIPTMIDVSGLGVFGTLIIDANGDSPRFRAHDETDQGGSTKIGGKGVSSEPTAVSATNDRVDAYFDLQGYQNIRAIGQVPHGDANTATNDPVIGGTETVDYQSALPSDNTAADVSKLISDLKGLLMTRNFGPRSGVIDLSDLDDTYDNTTTTNDSADIDNTEGYNKATFQCTLNSANTPTRIQFFLLTKNSNGTVYHIQQNHFWARWAYEDQGVSGGYDVSVTFDLPMCDEFAIRATATGTDSTNTFTLSNSEIYLGR